MCNFQVLFTLTHLPTYHSLTHLLTHSLPSLLTHSLTTLSRQHGNSKKIRENTLETASRFPLLLISHVYNEQRTDSSSKGSSNNKETRRRRSCCCITKKIRRRCTWYGLLAYTHIRLLLLLLILFRYKVS